jgi:hypothetical protein
MPTRVSDDAWRQFQEELAALERKPGGPLTRDELVQLTSEQRLALAKTEFGSLKRRYGLRVDDVLTFLPEKEVLLFLQRLMTST